MSEPMTEQELQEIEQLAAAERRAKIQGMLATLYLHQKNVELMRGMLEVEHECFEGISVESLEIVKGCVEKDKCLYQGEKCLARGGLNDGLYFCNQRVGYCEDDYFGHMYFPTAVDGEYIKVYYEC